MITALNCLVGNSEQLKTVKNKHNLSSQGNRSCSALIIECWLGKVSSVSWFVMERWQQPQDLSSKNDIYIKDNNYLMTYTIKTTTTTWLDWILVSHVTVDIFPL